MNGVSVSTKFGTWILRELDRRGWSQSEAARRGGISSTSISMVISGKMNPEIKFYRGVSRAFNLPLEDVLRQAGVLPAEPPLTINDRRMRYRVGGITMTDRMVELFESLNAEDQELFVLLLEKWADRLAPRVIGETPEE